MEAMRESWTDGRLDELSARMETRFDRVEGQIENQREELRVEVAGVEARLRSQASEHYARTSEALSRAHEDNRQLNAEVHTLHRTIARIGWAGMIALLVAGVGMFATVLF